MSESGELGWQRNRLVSSEVDAEDAAVSICCYLMSQRGWSLEKISRILSVPSFSIEHSIRNNEASAALRHQVTFWVQESRESANLPPALVDMLLVGALEQSDLSDGPGDDSAVATLDAISRAHFTELRASVGQNAMSILSDPSEAPQQANWGSWLGSLFYDALDYSNVTSVGSTTPVATGTSGGGAHGSASAARTAPGPSPERDANRGFWESVEGLPSSTLLSYYPVQTDFSKYLSVVAVAYSSNRQEARMKGGLYTASDELSDGELPWPHAVPAGYFSPDYDVLSEFSQMRLPYRRAPSTARGDSKAPQAPVGRVLTAAAGAAGPGPTKQAMSTSGSLSLSSVGLAASMPSEGKLLSVKVTGEDEGVLATPAVTMHTFAEDYEEVEKRCAALSSWKAVVDDCLLQHVQSKSRRFFSASQRFTMLGSDAEEALGRVRRTRQDIGSSGDSVVQSFVKVAHLYRLRQHLVALAGMCETIEAVVSKINWVESWVVLPERDMGDLVNAVTAFLEIQAIVFSSRGAGGSAGRSTEGGAGAQGSDRGDVAPVVDFQAVKALAGLPARTMELKKALQMLISEEIEASVRATNKWGHSTRERHLLVLLASHTMGTLGASVVLYQNVLCEAMWSLVAEEVVSLVLSSCTIDDKTANALLSLTQDVKHAAPQQKRRLLHFTTLLRVPQFMFLLQTVVDCLLDFTAKAAQHWEWLLLEFATVAPAVATALGAAEGGRRHVFGMCTACESVLAMLVDAREKANCSASSMELEALMVVCFSFIESLARIFQGVVLPPPCSEGGGAPRQEHWEIGRALRPTLTKHGKQYLRAQHEKSVEKMQVVIGNDSWKPMEQVDSAFQERLDTLVESSDTAIEAFFALAVSNICRSSVGDRLSGRHTGGSSGALAGGAAPGKTASAAGDAATDTGAQLPTSTDAIAAGGCSKLYISATGDDEGRVVSNSILMLIEVLYECDRNLGRYPFLAFDVVTKMYDLLKLFDAQCAVMLLGAMAVDSGALQRITVQHLALASQCVGLLCDIIPLYQRRLKRLCLGDKIEPFITSDLGRVLGDCTSHHHEFLLKIVSLTREKVESVNPFNPTEWVERGNDWIMSMLKEAARLLRQLRTVLSTRDLSGVMIPLLSSFTNRIREAIRSIPLGDLQRLRPHIESDVGLFSANVNKFGYNVIRCATISNVADVLQERLEEHLPDEESVVCEFFIAR